MTTCNNCFTNRPDCRTCPDRITMHSNLDIEQRNAEQALDNIPCWAFAAFIMGVSVVGTVALWIVG